MLKLLELRELGVDGASRLTRAETTRRTLRLQLSTDINVEAIHEAGINCLDLDPIEHRHLLSCDGQGLIYLHDVHNTSGLSHTTYRSVVSRLQADNIALQKHSYSAETVQWYTHDTGLFTSSGMDKLLKVWDTNSMGVANEWNFAGQIYSHHQSMVAVQHCLIAVGCRQDRVQLVDLKTGSAVHALRGHRNAVLATRWSPSEEFLLATAGEDSRIMFWDVRQSKGSLMILDQHNGDTTAGPQSVNTAHNGRVNGLCFLPDGLHLLSFGTDNTLRLWNSSTGRNCLVNYGHVLNESRKSIKLAVTLDTTPAYAFVPSSSDVDVIDVFGGGECVTSLRGHYQQVNCCCSNEDTHELLTGSNDRNVLVWTPKMEKVEWDCERVGGGAESEWAWARRRRRDAREEGGVGTLEVGVNVLEEGVRVNGRSGVDGFVPDSWSSDED